MQRLFGQPKALLGMIHVRALPGAPTASLTIDQIAEIAAAEAKTLQHAGFNGLIVENMHDRPYVMDVGPEVVACMTRVGIAIRDAAPNLPLGVQILSLSSRQTLAVAAAIGASFVRLENFAFAHVADEGLMASAQAGDALRYRRAIGAEGIAILADVKKKHASHAITGDVTLADAVAAAEFFLADGVIITGKATGQRVALDDLNEARRTTTLPVLAGSGANPEQIPDILAACDGVIVGSAIKKDGVWSDELDPSRCAAVVDAFRSAAP